MAGEETWPQVVAEAVCRATGCPPERLRTLGSVVRLAVELVHEGREGHSVGTLLVVGDAAEVIRHSRQLILDPLAGHDPSLRQIDDASFRETAKELAQLDGAFIIDDGGTCVSAARFIEVDVDAAAGLPAGLGARHAAALSISGRADAVGVAVSESSLVRVFAMGELRAEIAPASFGRERAFAIADAVFHEIAGTGLTMALAEPS